MPKTKKNENYRDSEYWEKRIANETWKTYNSLEEKNIDLLQMYEEASKQIKSELLELAEKAETNGSLNRTDQYRFQKLLGEQGSIYKECEQLGEQIELQSKNRMINGGEAVYGNVMESLNVNDYSMPNKKVMEQMLRKPWQGSNFSKRLWKNMAKLESTLNTVIVNGITTGKTVTEMAIQLSNSMNRSFNEAHRLVRTETINYLNQSAKLGYKDAGVRRVQWWAAADERTCPTCGANHGKTYPIDKVPNLPCHPGCRCTWLPVIDEENQKTGEYIETIELKEIDKHINLYENKIANEKIEHSYIIQTNGKVFHYKGTGRSVTFDDIDLNGAVITHNHPIIDGVSENTFEDDDFRFLKRHGMEIDRLRATYGDMRYEIKVIKDLSDVDLKSYKHGEIGEALLYGEIDGNLYDLIYQKMDKEGLIKYVKYKEKK